jgi:hypothetical protein
VILRRSGGSYLVDREWLAAFYGISPETIRKHLEPVTYEAGRALYDLDVNTEATLKAITPRRRPA